MVVFLFGDRGEKIEEEEGVEEGGGGGGRFGNVVSGKLGNWEKRCNGLYAKD